MKVPAIRNIFNEKSTNFTGQFAIIRLDILWYEWTLLNNRNDTKLYPLVTNQIQPRQTI